MAYEFYVTIEGKQQGRLKGESVREEHKDKLSGLSFHYVVNTAREGGGGMATGRRQHQPVSFVKEWGAASPQLFQALLTNEALTSVLFEFVKTNPNGEEYVFHTIELSNATVSAIEQYMTYESGAQSTAIDRLPLEKVSLTFQRIEIENADGKTSAIDEGGRIR